MFASITVSWLAVVLSFSSPLWIWRRFSDSLPVPVRSLTESVWPMIESNWISRAAGYKKVCCQYFLTKSQCETAQLCPGPLTRRKPILGSLALSLFLSVLCPAVQLSQTPGMSQTCAGGGEKQRGRCQLFVGAETRAGWLAGCKS